MRARRLMRAYHDMLMESVDRGPVAYAGDFRGRQAVGERLTNSASDVMSLSERLPNLHDELVACAQVLAGIAEGNAFPWQGGTGYSAFTENELISAVEAITSVLDLLPAVEPTGVASEDAPIPFPAAELPGHLEVLAASDDFVHASTFLATLNLRIRSLLSDPRLTAVSTPEEEIELHEWLTQYIGAEDGSNGNVTVIDLSLVPSEVLHLVIAVVARVIFEALQHYRRRNGVELPTTIVLEEAHTFIRRQAPDDHEYSSAARLCRESFERIAREGRKFGLGLVLSSQRPSELSQTVLAQCNTFLLHRLVNDRDQDLVSRLVPDNLGELLGELPSLPSQQAILLGWAAPSPVLVQMAHLPVDQRPQSADPAFWDVWTGVTERGIDWEGVARAWTEP
jgi:hypothetical protein